MQTIETLICAALRGESPAWPEASDEAFLAAFLERSAYHGVQALLDQWLQSPHGRERGWPTAITDACHDAAIAQAMWEMRHQALLKQVLARLSNSGVRPILFKGTALAYDVYPSPFLRRRGDTDLMIPSTCAPSGLRGARVPWLCVPVWRERGVRQQHSGVQSNRTRHWLTRARCALAGQQFLYSVEALFLRGLTLRSPTLVGFRPRCAGGWARARAADRLHAPGRPQTISLFR